MKSFTLLAVAWLAGGLIHAAELYDHRGPNQDGVFPARDYITDFSLKEKLILWKTRLPAEGQNTPIVVKDKVFLLCSNGIESDCPELFCLSIQDGKVLWRKPVDNLDALPADQQAEAKTLRHEELRLSHAARGLIYRLEQVLKKEDGKMVVTDQTAYDEVLAEARALGVLSEKGLLAYLDGGNPDNFPIPVMPMGNAPCRHPATTYAQKKRLQDMTKLKKNDWFSYEGWYYPKNLYTGRTFPSPVSDGTNVYVFTQDGTVACSNLEGKRKWLVDSMAIKGGNSSLVTASPALIGDTLVVYHCLTAVALNKNTGKVLWKHETGIPATYSEAGTPVHLVVNGEDYLYLGSSQILRLNDGKQVGKIAPPIDRYPQNGFFRGYLGSHFDSIGRGDLLWLVEDTNGGGGRRPTIQQYQLRKDGEQIVAELKWALQVEQPCVVMDGDRLHQVGSVWQVIEASTGEELEKGSGIRTDGKRYYGMTDQHLIAMASTELGQDRKTGRLDVEEARAMKPAGTLLVLDKKTRKEVGRVTIPMEPPEGDVLKRRLARVAVPIWQSSQGGNWGCSSPMPWGNRIIVRNNDAVYCIGMPGTEFRPPETR